MLKPIVKLTEKGQPSVASQRTELVVQPAGRFILKTETLLLTNQRAYFLRVVF